MIISSHGGIYQSLDTRKDKSVTRRVEKIKMGFPILCDGYSQRELSGNGLFPTNSHGFEKGMTLKGVSLKFSKTMSVAVCYATISGSLVSAVAVESEARAQITRTAPRPPSPQLLKMEVKSSCMLEGVLFEITNHGKEWPKKAFVELYFADSRSLFEYRKMRFKAGQKASFVVPQALSKDRSLGLWINPQWYKRKFSFDARIAC